MTQTFHVIIERDRGGYLVASVPAFPGCHTQAKSHDELIGPGLLNKILRDVELTHEPLAEPL